jgi:hypothetical protein
VALSAKLAIQKPPPLPQRRKTLDQIGQHKNTQHNMTAWQRKSDPIPMEVDPSIRTSKVDYGNFPDKKPNSTKSGINPDKWQSIFQILQEKEEELSEEDQAENDEQSEKEEEDLHKLNFLV